MDATEYPSWMKQHLRKRLEESKREQLRTGPTNGEPALVADENGRIKTITTDHKPLPPKNGWDACAPEPITVQKVFVQVDGKTVEGLLIASAANICCISIQSVIGTVFVYRHPDEVLPAFNFDNAILTKLGESIIDSVNRAREEQEQKLNLYGNLWREQRERDE